MSEKQVEETHSVIEKGNLEDEVIPDYGPHVYYNLTFQSEDRGNLQ